MLDDPFVDFVAFDPRLAEVAAAEGIAARR
jgi:hypothetical protein